MKRYAIILSLFLIIILIFYYGIIVGKDKVFPYKQLNYLQDQVEKRFKDENYTAQNEFLREINLNNLVDINPSNADSLRRIARDIIFGKNFPTKKFPEKIEKVKDNHYSDIKNLSYVEKFFIQLKNNIQSIGYIFYPKISNNRLFIYHQGHGGDFLKGISTITYFLEKGFTVYAFSMPLLGMNNNPLISSKQLGQVQMLRTKNAHENFKFFQNPIGYFIAPIVIMINYSQLMKYQDITMCGINGGGWTTVLAAAVDIRIQYSIPVAGSYPMYIRYNSPKTNWGDFEQHYSELYNRVNYLELYVLGSVGKNRKQLQIFNKNDPCCFAGDYSKYYHHFVTDKVNEFDSGFFDIFLDIENKVHSISTVQLELIYDFIN